MELSAPSADRVPMHGVTAFLAIAFGLAYAIESVFWIDSRHLGLPWAALILAGVMLTPAIATFVVTRWVEPPVSVRDFTGLRLGRAWGWYWAFGWLGIPALWIGSLVIGWAAGVLPADFVHSPANAILTAKAPEYAVMFAKYPHLAPIGISFINVAFAPIVNGIFTFGEEWGWRGYLLRALLPLGQWKALVLTGFLWGLWHAPIIALGYNYPAHHVLGPFLMIAFCVIIGILFGWTRLATGSVWPAVIAHATLNAFGGTLNMLGPPGSFDTAVAGLTGYTGWILPLALILFLAMTKRLPVPDPR